jgi:hypothetical protein
MILYGDSRGTQGGRGASPVAERARGLLRRSPGICKSPTGGSSVKFRKMYLQKAPLFGSR